VKDRDVSQLMQTKPYLFSPTNTELVSRCLNGESAAWDMLVERYAGLIRSVPARHGLPPDDIEDIAQDVFFALANNLDQLKDPEAIGKWVLVAARNRSLRLTAQRSKEFFVEDGGSSENGSSQTFTTTILPTPGLTELIELWSQQELLRYGLERLGDRCRGLLYMLFLDPNQPTYEEISDHFGFSKGSIGAFRKRCLKHLQSILEGVDVANRI